MEQHQISELELMVNKLTNPGYINYRSIRFSLAPICCSPFLFFLSLTVPHLTVVDLIFQAPFIFAMLYICSVELDPSAALPVCHAFFWGESMFLFFMRVRERERKIEENWRRKRKKNSS